LYTFFSFNRRDYSQITIQGLEAYMFALRTTIEKRDRKRCPILLIKACFFATRPRMVRSKMPVGILLQALVMFVLLMGILRGKFFQPGFKIFVQAALNGIYYGKLVLPSL
jgi:hypothetical protein